MSRNKNQYFEEIMSKMGLFKKKETDETKCRECGLELNDPQRLERHMKKAHRHPSQKNFDEPGSGGGMW